MSNVLDLPPEILSEIVDRLPLWSCMSFSLTCTHFAHVFAVYVVNMPSTRAMTIVREALFETKPEMVDRFWHRLTKSHKDDLLGRIDKHNLFSDAVKYGRDDMTRCLFDIGCKPAEVSVINPLIWYLRCCNLELPDLGKKLDLYIRFVKTLDKFPEFAKLEDAGYTHGLLQVCMSQNHVAALNFFFDTFVPLHPIEDLPVHAFFWLCPYVPSNGHEVARALLDRMTDEEAQKLKRLNPYNSVMNVVLNDRMIEIDSRNQE